MTDTTTPIQVEILPTKIWIEDGMCGDRSVVLQHQGLEPFVYARFNYNYAYTSNSGTWAAAHKLALSLGASEPVEVRQVWLHDSATSARIERHAQELAAYALTVSNLRAELAERGGPVAWRYQTPTGWHAVTNASTAHRVNQYHQIEPLYAAPQPAAPDAHALFWELRSKILALPRYSFLRNKSGGVEKVADSCGEWIDVYAAAWLCEDVRVDAMIAAAPQPAQPERPVNCGTGHCSCIECVMQPELTDAEICDVAKRTETAEPGATATSCRSYSPAPSSPPTK